MFDTCRLQQDALLTLVITITGSCVGSLRHLITHVGGASFIPSWLPLLLKVVTFADTRAKCSAVYTQLNSAALLIYRPTYNLQIQRVPLYFVKHEKCSSHSIPYIINLNLQCTKRKLCVYSP